MSVKIGVDFDNTIVCYDEVFHRVARERDLIPPDTPENKGSVRNYLRAVGKEDVWTAMQGEIYGGRMKEALPFPGAIDFFRNAVRNNMQVFIVSHKTRVPYSGGFFDLQGSALDWLDWQGFFDPGRIGLGRDRVFFEETKAGKLSRIAGLRCTHFIDDLPEFLSEEEFPPGTARLLFSPAPPDRRITDGVAMTVFRSWREIGQHFGVDG